jgi:hypothetical protein
MKRWRSAKRALNLSRETAIMTSLRKSRVSLHPLMRQEYPNKIKLKNKRGLRNLKFPLRKKSSNPYSLKSPKWKSNL